MGLKKRSYAMLLIGIVTLSTIGVLSYLAYYRWSYEPAEFEINGMKVNDFAYILQYDTFGDRSEAVDALKETQHDLIIMDSYYDTSSEGGRWTAEEIDRIRNEGEEKLALCYVSIGEAENYRPYWDEAWDANNDGVPDAGAPEWLDVENPDWEGNYKVKYWHGGWQAFIFGSPDAYLDKVMAQGFDGVYMDIVDAFEYYEQQGVKDAAERMVAFVGAISSYAKANMPNFLIVPQNGEALAKFAEYLASVDGIGREDVFYMDNTRNDAEEVEYVLDFLALFLTAKKFVLEIEYPTFFHAVDACYHFATDHGFLCYVGPRELDEIQDFYGYAPS
jgi:cysteinyl-tRNA synthetase